MKLAAIVFALALVLVVALFATIGDGGFRRMVTITGIYSICRPDNYDAVCFMDADGRDGGLFCMPLSTVGGKCQK